MTRMHREDLRAIVAAILQGGRIAANRDGAFTYPINEAEGILAELERTAKPDAPAPVPDAGIPPMPEPSQFFYPLSADHAAAFDHASYAQSLEAWGRDLTARLTASNALCAELAEALKGIIKHPPCSDPDCCSTAIANARATDRGAAALAKFKEATR